MILQAVKFFIKVVSEHGVIYNVQIVRHWPDAGLINFYKFLLTKTVFL